MKRSIKEAITVIAASHERYRETGMILPRKEGTVKVGIIRCRQTEDLCPGTTDFAIARAGKGVFTEHGPVEIIGFVSCGGCPGKRAVARARMLVERGAEAVVLASCIGRGNPIGFPCPHFAQMRDAIRAKIGEDLLLLEWTH
jgi:predicted metal-binding protein